jgi:DNA-binding NarL/FixJ family response regulator
MKKISIVIVDDHDLFRAGLRLLIEGYDEFEVVAEAKDGQQSLEVCRQFLPDIVLLDVRMPRLDGLAAAQTISRECPKTSIIMVTMHADPEYLRKAFLAGASGYVLKDASSDEILTALRSVVVGHCFVNADLAVQAITSLHVPERETLPESSTSHLAVTEEMHSLTVRETEVLGLVAKGKTNKEIARSLNISPGTVKVHVERLISKLGVADRTRAAVVAVQCGLVTV